MPQCPASRLPAGGRGFGVTIGRFSLSHAKRPHVLREEVVDRRASGTLRGRQPKRSAGNRPNAPEQSEGNRLSRPSEARAIGPTRQSKAKAIGFPAQAKRGRQFNTANKGGGDALGHTARSAEPELREGKHLFPPKRSAGGSSIPRTRGAGTHWATRRASAEPERSRQAERRQPHPSPGGARWRGPPSAERGTACFFVRKLVFKHKKGGRAVSAPPLYLRMGW